VRDLSDSNLLIAQQAKSLTPLIKVVLTHGVNSYTYGRDRILDLNHPEEPFSQKAELVLDNSDGVLTDIDLQGFEGVISYGVLTKDGEEYSACAPMKVLSQNFGTTMTKMDCRFSLFGIPNQMAYDEASASYMPESTDNKTVKTLLGQIIGATLACYSHCEAFEIVWDSEDSLIGTYKPKDSFRIYVGGKRLAAVRRLLEYTKCVLRFQNDGKAHISVPKTTGVGYDYEYSLESGHSFFSKAYRNRLVLPNFAVVQSQKDDDPQYSGTASDPASYALLPKRTYLQTRLESNAQATAIAEAMIAQHQLWSEMGSADVPMNVGAEVFDYVKVAAFSAEDVFRVGNLGHLCRHYNAERAEWRMTFSFGNWMTVRRALADIGITDPGDIEGYFTRLYAKDAYIENLTAENILAGSITTELLAAGAVIAEKIDMIWLDPDSNVDLSLIGDTLDSLPDGATYARTRWLHLDAETGLTMKESQIYYIRLSPDSDEVYIRRQDTAPTPEFTGEYWIDTSGASSVIKRWTSSQWITIDQDEIDALNRGVLTVHTKLASLSVDGLVLLDEVEVDWGSGTYGLTLRSDYEAGHIKLSALVEDSYHRSVTDGEMDDWDDAYDNALTALDLAMDIEDDIIAGRITLSEYTDIDGEWYKTGGVRIHASEGILIYGVDRAFVTRASRYGTDQCYVGSDGSIRAAAGGIRLDSVGLKLRGEVLFLQTTGGSTYGTLSIVGTNVDLFAVDDLVLAADNIRPQGLNMDMSGCDYLDMPERSSHPTGRNGRRYHHTVENRNYQYVEGAWDIDS